MYGNDGRYEVVRECEVKMSLTGMIVPRYQKKNKQRNGWNSSFKCYVESR